jgi:monofunctional biosynthetic peptidoglycan transglycosylase
VSRLANSFEELRGNAQKPRGPRNLALWLFLGVFFATVWVPLSLVFLFGAFDPPSTMLMLQRAGEGQKIKHQPVPIRQISPHLVRAVIAAEDARFCEHDGFDTAAIEKAMAYNKRAEKRGSQKRRGASTISQQTAKNIFLWPQRSWVRKGLEAYFTVLIEFIWPKQRVMEAYLNAAEWGDGLFGAEAAAQGRFKKRAKDLTPAEAARLAAVLPSPNKWSATSPGKSVRGRAAAIQARMYVVHAQGLAACVLPRGAEAPPPKKRVPTELPPLPVPPPELAPPEDAEMIPVQELPAGPEALPPEAGATEAPPEPSSASGATPPLPEPPPGEAPAEPNTDGAPP